MFQLKVRVARVPRLRPAAGAKSRLGAVRASGRLTIAQRFIAGTSGIRDEVRQADD